VLANGNRIITALALDASSETRVIASMLDQSARITGTQADEVLLQLPEDHPQIVACAAQHCLHRVTECAFEPVAIEFSVCFHVADGRLDCASPLDHRA
jgi:hypothetical protein